MQNDKLRTPEEVQADFARKGISYSAWATARGYNCNLVIEVINGKRKCLRGQSHKIAVELGIKDGEIASLDSISLAA